MHGYIYGMQANHTRRQRPSTAALYIAKSEGDTCMLPGKF